MTTKQTAELANILTDRRTLQLAPVASLVRKACATGKVSAGKIFREMIALGMRRNGLTQREYLANRLYRSDLSTAEKREFVGEIASFKLNERLAPPNLTRLRGFLNDKVAITSLWQRFGLPTTQTQAVFTPDRWLGDIPTLRSAQDIRDFLTQSARYPLFGKPAEGFQGLGSVLIANVDAEAGKVFLSGGEIIDISDLVAEIVRVFPDGYLFQDVVAQHPDISEMYSTGLSCVRFVTVVADTEPEILYAVWKIAAPSAICDNFWQQGSILARINAETGIVESCISGSGPDMVDVSKHPQTGAPIVGYQLPFWQEAKDLVWRAHAVFPVNGCLGWDVAFTGDGPLIIECNDNPGHETYQLAFGRGAMNNDLKPIFDKIEARNKRIVEDRKARVYKIEH